MTWTRNLRRTTQIDEDERGVNKTWISIHRSILWWCGISKYRVVQLNLTAEIEAVYMLFDRSLSILV